MTGEVRMRSVTVALSFLTLINWVLLVLVWRRDVALSRRPESRPSEPGELVRRLVRSHVAAKRLLVACSAAEAHSVSAKFAERHQELATAVAAVGEFATDPLPDH